MKNPTGPQARSIADYIDAIKEKRYNLHPRELWHDKWPNLAFDLDWLIDEVDRCHGVLLNNQRWMAGLAHKAGGELRVTKRDLVAASGKLVAWYDQTTDEQVLQLQQQTAPPEGRAAEQGS